MMKRFEVNLSPGGEFARRKLEKLPFWNQPRKWR